MNPPPHEGRPGGDDSAGAMKVAQISTPKAGTGSCARRPARWGGLKTAHCAACHETFTTVTAFDRHRRGLPDDRHCVDPLSVGLVDAGRAYICWAFPGRREYEGDS
jgi:hypothetical protein